MTDPHSPAPHTPVERPPDDRLDSWKEIAAYMKRDVKTVQRWEKREGMPVHRHVHDKMGSVYAFRSDLDAWTQHRRLTQAAEVEARPPSTRRLRWAWGAMGALIASVVVVWQFQERDDAGANPLAEARFLRLTDFGGIEQAAAIARDGMLVAFLSDRDGPMDVWITRVGSGEFYNLTRGSAREIVNPSVRALDFSPDGTLVTFWARRLDASHQSEISIWGVPVLGGPPRVYLDGVAEYDWTDDGARLVYHTPGPGDPTFVRAVGEAAKASQIFSAPAGLHSHFQIWSPDGAFIYFVQGSVPDRMDLWRIRPTGGTPERITSHDAVVSYPVVLNPQTLLYLSTDRDGSGPWIYSVDIDQRVPHRVSFGIDRYTSLAASADGRRLVATMASPKGTLWRVPIGNRQANSSDARAISLTTGSGSFPRLGDRFLLYVSSKGTSDSIWRFEGDRAIELWSAPDTRIVGGPAIARDGGRIAFTLRGSDGRTLLSVANIDGTDARIVARSLELQGAPAWAPDGESITVAGVVDGIPRLFRVPLDGRPPMRFVEEHSVDPVWSPSGDIVVFSGADIGTTFPLKAVGADGRALRTADLTLSRGARRVAFMPGQRSLVVLRGEIRHKNLWLIDLETGAERQLTNFATGFDVRDFDISPDGREIVVEQVQENSDIVMLDVTQR